MNQDLLDERRLLDVIERAALLARPGKEVAIVAAETGNAPRTDNLPASLRQSAIERLAALDPLADWLFELECPTCNHDAKVMFDPGVALLAQAGQDASPMHRAALADVPGGPGATGADFLERLMRRHMYDATVHPLTG